MMRSILHFVFLEIYLAQGPSFENIRKTGHQLKNYDPKCIQCEQVYPDENGMSSSSRTSLISIQASWANEVACCRFHKMHLERVLIGIARLKNITVWNF